MQAALVTCKRYGHRGGDSHEQAGPVAVAATIILGVLAVADALLISITERAPELATIRSFGWPEPALRRLILTEGALTGLAGGVTEDDLGRLLRAGRP